MKYFSQNNNNLKTSKQTNILKNVANNDVLNINSFDHSNSIKSKMSHLLQLKLYQFQIQLMTIIIMF